MSLSYNVQRSVDDFITGMARQGHGYWVRVVAEPTIDSRHRTEVEVELGYNPEPMHPHLITPIGKYTMRVYPSTLYDLDDYLRDGYDPNLWLQVECEEEWTTGGRRSRKYRITDRVDRRLGALETQTAEKAPSGPSAAISPPGEGQACKHPAPEQVLLYEGATEQVFRCSLCQETWGRKV